MIYVSEYLSPIGKMLLAEKNEKLVGAWFYNQKYFMHPYENEKTEYRETKVLKETKIFLNKYFNGEKAEIPFDIIELNGSNFQKSVWKVLCEIPYGKTVTYKYIAEKIALKKGVPKMSAQAVGGAVGRNPISIIVPCHRVVGTSGSLTGYAAGTNKKLYLLNLENKNIK